MDQPEAWHDLVEEMGFADTSQDRDSLVEILNETAMAFNAAAEQDPGTVEKSLALIRKCPESAFQSEAVVLVTAVYLYSQGMTRLRTGGDSAAAYEALTNARETFMREHPLLDRCGEIIGGEVQSELTESLANQEFLAETMSLLAGGLAEAERGNFDKAVELFDQFGSKIKHEGAHRVQMAQMAAELEPAILFLAAGPTGITQGIEAARKLVDRSFESARYAAQMYHNGEENAPGRSKLLGQAYSYKAYLAWWEVADHIERWAFNEIRDEQQLVKLANQAIEHLSQAEGSSVAKIEVGNMHALQELLGATADFGSVVTRVLTASVNPKDSKAIIDIKQRLDRAKEAVSLGGNEKIVLKGCDYLGPKVENLRLLYRPKLKDFGIFAGIISCSAFAVLFVGLSMTNALLDMGLEGSSILQAALVLGLAAGFGLGATKFRDLLFGQFGKSSDEGKDETGSH